jgi:TolB-like protein
MRGAFGHKSATLAAEDATSATTIEASATVPEKSVAVLPFVDMSEKHDQEYFSDGLSEELIDKLAHTPDLKVIARTSSFTFKGKSDDIRTIGHKLGVANLLEGSVRTSGRTIRVTAQLISVVDGTHRWSETYDRRQGDVLRVQDEIAAAVVKALKGSLLEESPASADTTNNAEAYALYLQGNYYAKSETKKDFVKAVAALEHAVRLSPASARYWAELSRAYTGQTFADATLAWNTMRNLAVHAADKAMSLDPNLPEAHIARAKIAWYLDIDFPVVIAEIAKAKLLAPNNPSVMLWSAAVAHLLGNDEEAIRITKRLAVTDPLSPNIYADLSSYCFAAGRYEDAESAARKALDLNGSTGGMHFIIGLAMVQLGRNRDTAMAEIARESDAEGVAYGLAVANQLLGNTKKSDSWLTAHESMGRRSDTYSIAVLHTLRGDFGQAFMWLDRAYAIRDSNISEIKTDPFLTALRKDVRYSALLRKVGLPE